VSAETVAGRDDYVDFCEGIRRLCQIDLLQYKRNQMERRIRTFAERRGIPGLLEYLLLLRQERTELDRFLDRITINVSQLWRNPEQWTMLAGTVLPELATAGRIRAWSAGCSYGAEAYTLAAVCRDAVPAARLAVRGTDIDERVVARARQARFSEDDTRDAPPAALARWFDRVAEGWQAKAALRQVTTFEVGDLLRIAPAPESHDLILCRNTVIYFQEPVRDELHARLARALRPGGYLLVGSTERVNQPAAMGLSAVRPFTYRKA